MLVGEQQPTVVPARPFGERETVEHRAQLSHRRPFPVAVGRHPSSASTLVVGLGRRRRAEVVELAAERLGQRGHDERGEQRRDAAERDGAADAAEAVGELPGDEQPAGRADDADPDEERVRRAAHLGREQLGVERGEHDARARAGDRRDAPT